MIAFDQHEPYFFDLVRESDWHECSSWLIALAAIHHGLDATFYRSQSAAKVSLPGLPKKTSDAAFLKVSDGRRERFFFGSQSDRLSMPTLLLTRDKLKTRGTLIRKGIPVPAGGIASAKDISVLKALVDQGVRRFVVKPVDASLGKGVHSNQSVRQVQDILQGNKGASFVLEQYVAGREFRVFVVNGSVAAATGRSVASVVGDGNKTVGQLLVDREATRACYPFAAMKALDANDLELALLMQGVSRLTVPAPGRAIKLTTKDIPGRDSEYPDMTSKLPSGAADVAVLAAQTLGASVCGIDLIVHPGGQTILLEANCRPMLRMHSFPYPDGRGNLSVPEAILAQFFPIDVAEDAQLEKRVDFVRMRAALIDAANTSGAVEAKDYLVPDTL